MRRTIALFALLTLGALSLIPPQPADAQVAVAPSLLNFQGRLLKPDGTPLANGTYSLRFSLWDGAIGGIEKWNQTLHSVTVRNGTFAVLLNTNTANLFHSNLWLEIKIGTDAPLTPRQQLVSVAYAMKANSVPDGSIGAAQIANGSLTAEKFASGTLNSLSWLLGGNSGTNPASQFLGTTDPQPLVFRTNNLERMRIAPGGNVSLRDNSWFEFGAGVAGKEVNAGKIAYQRFTSDSLEFIGAGTSNTNRKVYFFAEGGTTFNGEVTARVVTITGGSDVAEPYNVAPAGDIAAIPGYVVAIDPNKVGQMKVAGRAYDKTVAGIISGANGIHPGITLRQKGTIADGELPVASIGRVWCWCDADANGAIEAGDMLTTSDTPGHAMKVSDHTRANGAVIGKAMSSLKSGKGLALVLVSLK